MLTISLVAVPKICAVPLMILLSASRVWRTCVLGLPVMTRSGSEPRALQYRATASQQTFADGHGHSARHKIRPYFSKDQLSEDGLAEAVLLVGSGGQAWHGTRKAPLRDLHPSREMVSIPRSLVQGTSLDPTVWLLLLFFFPTKYPGSSIDGHPGQADPGSAAVRACPPTRLN